MPRRIIALALVALGAACLPAAAQSFGRNKVQYEDFDFRILETPHFDLYYYPAEHDAAVQAGRLAERWYARLSRMLDHTFSERQVIVLYASHAQFAQTTVIPGFLGEGVGGVTEHEKGRIVLPFVAGLRETDHVLGHELVHAFQRDILRQSGRSLAILPLWFAEGMAEYLSIGGIDPNTAMWLRDAVEQQKLPRLDQLDDPSWFPYRYGQALWTYLAARFGENIAARSLRVKAPGGAIGWLVKTTGVDAQTLSKQWQAWIRETSAAPALADRDASKAILDAGHDGGKLNVGPAVSPDGRSLVFLSERDRYSIDVFLADAATGRIRRTIIQTAGDPHFDSLQFIESAGAWAPDGRRFALAALSQGQPVLTILDMRSGEVAREIHLDELDQVFSPTWSPDGRQIAFSAVKGGFSDLYVYDLAAGTLRALTQDAFADLQPSWSPDGRTIVFSTDRFSSSVETLTFGNYRLATIDPASGAMDPLPAMPNAKNIDPHWSGDGASVYFIADPGGVSNVYRLAVAGGALFQITHVSTGVSGVTALSPALSVAQDANRLVFSTYHGGAYEIHDIEAAGGDPVLASVPLPGVSLRPAVGVVAATEAGAAPIKASLVPAVGLADAKDFTERPYHRGLTLDRLVQPYLTAGGGGGTGGFMRAGVSLSFGDMLNDQRLRTTIQVGKRLEDFAAQAAYVNLGSRWNWGVIGGQIPWLIGGGRAQSVLSTTDNVPTLTQTGDIYRELHRQASGLASYPFSSARRVDLTAGVHSIAFDRETTTNVYSAMTGRLLTQSTVSETAARPARLYETSAALVYDTAVFGPTSPVLGERYRLGIAPTFGDLSFATVTADYRRYLMPVRPFTIALRAMHVGRYGSGADDPRLLPLVWTLRDVVRGYGDIGPASTASLDYLESSRLAVANLELRFPLLDVLGRGPSSGPLPLEGLVFADAGEFWTRNAELGTAVPRTLRSLGAGVRLNAAGMVFELDAVRPFDGPSPGWSFSFNFRPGF